MWVRLLKADKKRGLPVGHTIRVLGFIGRQMIEEKKAFEYTGTFPIKKMKTDFFKPK
jgi:hypothetical protein